MQNVGYYNGKMGALEEMTVPMLDRAMFFGDGCYDATMFANNIPFALDEHMDRFYDSCRALEIDFDMSREALRAELQKCIDANENADGFLYWQCSRGTWARGHAFPPAHVKPNLLIFTVPCGMAPLDEEVDLISMEDTRFLHCNIKTLNLLPNVIAYQRCREQDCFETVFHRGERVTECAHSSVLMLQNGVLCAPPRDNLILPGITMKHLLELARENGIPTREAPFTMDELRAADEVIISSSGDLCIRARTLDGRPVGGRDEKTLRILQAAYNEKYLRETKQI
ncbi:MAG: aminotransferase class IV [Butyricicoccus sp.]|nr:aminotransferase class IV [Butyricicoccus sp.]